MHIYFVSMEAFVATLTTAGSPRTCVSVEQRGETKSARENSESTLCKDLYSSISLILHLHSQ